jgi:hypothetical protein
MKTKTTYYGYLILVIVIISFVGCKKYPENNLWLHSPYNTIADDWKINYYLVDGVDSTNYQDISAYVNGTITFSKGETQGTFGARDKSGILSLSQFAGSSGGFGSWELDTKKKNVRLNLGRVSIYNVGVQKDVFRASGYWKIKKLTTKEFWITNSLGNVNFEIRFKK